MRNSLASALRVGASSSTMATYPDRCMIAAFAAFCEGQHSWNFKPTTEVGHQFALNGLRPNVRDQLI
jgi:hypothetical protein